MKKYNFITKKFLRQEYIINKKSQLKIAKQIGCSKHTINNKLKKFKIKFRILNKTKQKYYCIDCKKGIHYSTIFRNKRCISCALKNRFKNPKNHPMFGRKGKKHPSYKHGEGRFPYPLEFNDELKLKIRKRDNYICQKCRITEEEHIIVYGRVLDVHHIDYNKKNINLNNLITFCRSCNSRANFNRKYWTNHFLKIREVI